MLWVNYINPIDDDPLSVGKYNLQALAPYEYDLIRDPLTGEPLIFILHYPDTTITGGDDGVEQVITESQKDTAAQSKIYSIYTKDFKVKIKRTVYANQDLDAKIQIIETKANDIKMLPIAFLSKDLAIDYPLPSQLTNKSIDWNVLLSDLKTASAAQGHGQLVIKHPQGQAIEEPTLGKHTAILLPQSSKEKDGPTEASYINASPDLGGQLDVIKFDLINILDDEGIQAKSAIEGGIDGVTSGFDRLLKEADVQDIIEDNQALYVGIEQDVYLIIQAIENHLSAGSFNSPTINVSFEKPKVMISDAETLANIEKRETLGLLKSYEKHLIINPNLSEAEAQKREEEIQAEAKVKLKEMQDTMSNEDSSEEEEDTEEESDVIDEII